jgi:PAS domain S-box-containing protein
MVNRRLCEILGYSEAELLTKTFQEITHPKDLEPDLALANSLLAGEIERFEMEKRYLKRTGEIIWADLTASILRDADGEPLNFISVVADIGARKQTEERLNFLLGELAHRSKNLIAVILAAVRQIGARASSVDEFQTDLIDRLLTISGAQDVLVRQDFVGAPVADLIMGQLSTFVTPADPRLKLHGPHLVLDAASTHALGLAMHELATNACKHGALSSAEGEVVVTWDAIGPDGDQERFIMSWTERGGPRVEPPGRRGFGRRVIEQMLASSLGGEVELSFEPEGLVWRLDAPASCIEGRPS